MKFRLVEEFNNEVYRDLEELLIDEFYKLSESDLMKYYNDDMETGGGAVWLLPNGNTIRLDLHQDLPSEIFYYFCKSYFEAHPEYSEDYDEDDFALEDAHDFNDRLVDYFDWVKFNSGTIYDDRCYVCLPQSMTNPQFRVLEDLIDKAYNDGCNELLVLPQDTRQNRTYSFQTYSSGDILKRIRKFYMCKVLEESKLNEASIDPEGKYTDFGTGKVINDNIFDDRTHVSFYDQLFTNPEQMVEEENLKGHIEMLSPKEYYEICATKIFPNSSVEALKRSREADPRVLEKIKEIIVKYKRQVFLPYLNYAEQNQEGLHRMLVAAELFGWDHKFPVLIIEWADEELALQRKKAKEEDRIRRYIRDAVDSSLHYNYDKLEEFEEECKAQVDYKFDFIEEPVKSFSVKHNNDGYTEVEVNNVVYQFDTDKINVKPSMENSDNVDELEWDDLDIELDDLSDEELSDLNDLSLDDFLKKYGM